MIRSAATSAGPAGVADGAASALLEGLVDYAGLFPPAALPMRDAVLRYLAYRAGPHARMLGRFVVPRTRLEEMMIAVANESAAWAAATVAPLAVSVLAEPADFGFLDPFPVAVDSRYRIDCIEVKAPDEDTVALAARRQASMPPIYVEVDVRRDPSPLIAAIARHGLRAKIRTGGVTADAFPTTTEVLRFLSACVAAKVPFKATAGLHHPIRGDFALTYAADAPRGTMHGFLNVFVAALFLRAGVRADDVAPLLEERDPSAIAFTSDGVEWRGHRVGLAAIRAARAEFAGSFGSCSFEEPVDDLARLQLA